MLDRLSLRIRVLLFFLLIALGGIAAIVAGGWLTLSRSPQPGLDGPLLQAGLIAGFLIVFITTGIWYLFDANVARAIDGLSTAIRSRAHADVTGGLTREAAQARYLGDLAPAAEAISASLAQTRSALAESVARETARLSAEKSRLEKLLSDVPVAVLLCNADFQLAFYNGQAVTILEAGAAPGLDRNLLDYLREGPVRHAYDRLANMNDPDAVSDLMCATTASGRLLSGRMRVLRRTDNTRRPGFVLTLRDVTADLSAHAAREALLTEVFDRVRRPAANLQTVIGVLSDSPELAQQGDLTQAMQTEVRVLTSAITQLSARHDATRGEWMPQTRTRSRDLLDGIQAQFAAQDLALTTEGPELILTCDGFELALFFRWLGTKLAETGRANSFRLVLSEEDGPGAILDLDWLGAPLPVGEFDGWLTESIDPELPDVTARSVLMAHLTEAWTETRPDGRATVRLPIPQARRATRRPPPIEREVVYDFELLSKERNAGVLESRLQDLTYVVFDTETTGLTPSADEIVQIAAVRVVNGRRVRREVFDTLVDPGRPIPKSSTDVHGITEDMVKGAPSMVEAGKSFHEFARGAVLIAHNAPFDMEFLRRYEKAIGVQFDNPVLDTVLLSAVVYGQLEQHSLDALTARLGITIPEEARHTAIGDTVATADAFLKLLPMLQAQGLETFGAVLAEVRRHGRLLKDLNTQM
ncbi:DNA polymerase III PolC-type [Roseibaca ekhonensis]|jgi:DNA polymerase-3 subunit epsilon|uniref:DNA-directed DNA polymerase n=1 Tax=Roseinatronobacter ekhonensis TaxID=254356 RepID=A0A3B0M4Q5_9RHOB|nr:3'-5' exonuclease [Roseibaca ekhonensis]SUZ30500.1 DNA polymerase III PolC-type [Roseibaca ekhonensis]